MRMSTAAWKSLEKTLGFPTFTTGLVIACNMIMTFTQRRSTVIRSHLHRPPLQCIRRLPVRGVSAHTYRPRAIGVHAPHRHLTQPLGQLS